MQRSKEELDNYERICNKYKHLFNSTIQTQTECFPESSTVDERIVKEVNEHLVTHGSEHEETARKMSQDILVPDTPVKRE